jgi:hypothetical protein
MTLIAIFIDLFLIELVNSRLITEIDIFKLSYVVKTGLET